MAYGQGFLGPPHELRTSLVQGAREFRQLAELDLSEDSFTQLETSLAEQLKRLLDELERAIARAELDDPPALTDEGATDVLAAVHAWASLASRTVAEVYAPNSPFPWNVGGWGKRIGRILQRIATRLGPLANKAARTIGASGASVAVTFPWGVSVSIQWAVAPSPTP